MKHLRANLFSKMCRSATHCANQIVFKMELEDVIMHMGKLVQGKGWEHTFGLGQILECGYTLGWGHTPQCQE